MIGDNVIDPIYLIDNTFVDWTKEILQKNTLTVYLDKSLGDLRPFVKEMVKETDKMLDIKFKFKRKEKKADIRFYQKDQVHSDPLVIGFAEYYDNSHWNISVSRNYATIAKPWILLHEFGHTLGLEHPFNSNDGDYYVTTNPWGNGATTNDTVMAYQQIDDFPVTWRTADRDALTGIWG